MRAEAQGQMFKAYRRLSTKLSYLHKGMCRGCVKVLPVHPLLHQSADYLEATDLQGGRLTSESTRVISGFPRAIAR